MKSGKLTDAKQGSQEPLFFPFFWGAGGKKNNVRDALRIEK
jgi:hypothetical protein